MFFFSSLRFQKFGLEDISTLVLNQNQYQKQPKKSDTHSAVLDLGSTDRLPGLPKLPTDSCPIGCYDVADNIEPEMVVVIYI